MYNPYDDIERLYVKDMGGEERQLINFSLEEVDEEGGKKYIEVEILDERSNREALKYFKNLNSLIYKGNEYIINNVRGSISETGATTKRCLGLHKLFRDLDAHYIDETFTGTIRLQPMLDFCLKGSKYKAVVTNASALRTSVEVENFGDGKSIDLALSVVERFEAEFDYDGYTIYVSDHFGKRADEWNKKAVYRLNMNNIEQEIDTTEFYTHIRGYADVEEEADEGDLEAYKIKSEYISPLFGQVKGLEKLEMPTYKNGAIRNKPFLDDRLKELLTDKMPITLTFEQFELEDMGFYDVNRGDEIWVKVEPFGIDAKLRATSVTRYENKKTPSSFTFGPIAQTTGRMLASFSNSSNTVKSLVDKDTGKLKPEMIPPDNRLNGVVASMRSLLYTQEGVENVDNSNIQNKVRFGNKGIETSETGHSGYKETINGKGLNLEATYGRLGASKTSIGPETSFANGYDPSKIVIPDIPDIPESPYKEMRWGVLGDSISVTPDYATIFYHDVASDILDIGEVVNYGVSGSRYTNSPDRNDSFVQRYSNMEDNLDIITVFGGVNDASNSMPIGSESDRDPSTFYGACHILYSGLSEKYIGKRIGVFSPIQTRRDIPTLKDYVDVEKEVCEYYSIPFLNLFTSGGINANSEQVVNNLMPDFLHPNNRGQEVIGRKIAHFIQSL